jgi:hypothetical protein
MNIKIIEGINNKIAITEANWILEPLAEYRVIGKVVTKGNPTKKVPVNSNIDCKNTKTALAINPGAARGSVTFRNALPLEAPKKLILTIHSLSIFN